MICHHGTSLAQFNGAWKHYDGSPCPPKEEGWQPATVNGMSDEQLTLEEVVFQTLGAASVCWENPGGAGVFDSTRCKTIGDYLMRRIRTEHGTYDDATMHRVHTAISRALLGRVRHEPTTGHVIDAVVTDVITSLQNAGILFRERAQ